jgi:hypothetical protein
MIFLALIAAISNGFASGACVQFYFVDFCNAAGSANVGRLSVFVFAAHYFSVNKQQAGSKRERERQSLCWLLWLLMVGRVGPV